MMKRYLLTAVVAIQPMSYSDAQSQYEKIKTLAEGKVLDTPGFVVYHTRPLQLEWVPEYTFYGAPFDKDLDILKHYNLVLEEISEYIKKYSKSATSEQRNVIYNINRHLKAINLNFKRLLTL